MEKQTPPLLKRKRPSHIAKPVYRKQLRTASITFIGQAGHPPGVNIVTLVTIKGPETFQQLKFLLGKHKDLNLNPHYPHKSRHASVTSGSGTRQEEPKDSLTNQWSGKGRLHFLVETLYRKNSAEL